MRCPKCGNESDGKFCGICGAKLEDNTVQSNNNEVYEFNFNANQSAEQQSQFNVNQPQQVEQQAQFNANQGVEQQPQFNVNQQQQVEQPQFDSNNIAFTSGEHFEGKGFNINEKINKINQSTTQLNSEDIKFTSGDFINQNNNVNNGAPVFGNQNNNVNNGVPTFGNQNNNVNNGAPVFGNQNGNVNNGAPVFGDQNNYNNNANVQSNNVTPNSITKRINKDNLKKPAFLLGTIGSIVLIISVFLTYVSISMPAFEGTMSQGVKLIDGEDGKFFLILAIISLVFSVLYLGIPTLVTAGIEFILGIYEVANSSKIVGEEVSEYLSRYIDVNFGPGAILLIIGSIAVLVGGIMMYRETKRKFAFNINNIGQQFADTMQDRANNLGNDYTNSFGNTSQNGNVQNNNMQRNTMNIPNGNVANSNMNMPNGSMPNNNINIPNSNINIPNNNVNMSIPNGGFDVNRSVNLNKDNDSQIPPQ